VGEEWADPRLIITILHNDDLNQVTWEMRAMEGAPKFAESQTLPDVDYAAFRGEPRPGGDQRRQARRARACLGPGAGR
jgi:pyruvate dehydrogenase (quinone)